MLVIHKLTGSIITMQKQIGRRWFTWVMQKYLATEDRVLRVILHLVMMIVVILMQTITNYSTINNKEYNNEYILPLPRV
jgi:hypothetical protein